MTRVKLNVHYIGRGARGRPGQVLDLDDTAAARLISSGRATRQPDLVKSAKPKRRRTNKADDPFLNPDAGPDAPIDPAHGRQLVPDD